MIDFLSANWLWLLVLGFFIAMHAGGHGCGMHGSHGGRHDHRQTSAGDERTRAVKARILDRQDEDAR